VSRRRRRPAHGLVLGKMYPPHIGHELLIRTAAHACDRVTVLVMAHPCESLPVDDRVGWLRRSLDDEPNVTIVGGTDPHPVDCDDPVVWELHMAVFRSALATVTAVPVEAVFTSEPYGAELARRFGAAAVTLDPGRALIPVSGRAVRADPVGCWEQLPPAVRGGLARRVVVVGAESTGTTTVSRQLADRLRRRGGAHGLTRWVPELGRDHTIGLLADLVAERELAGRPTPTMDDLPWPTVEFVRIAEGQNALEDREAPRGGPVLVCDTDAFATGIWHERYKGWAAPKVDALARVHPLYLLTHHDGVPFEQDGIRDGEQIRAWMTDRFADALAATGRRHVVLRGPLAERVDAAEAAVDDLLAGGWGFTDPVTMST
jgi:HTH-type transcriptional regulator, transcriptional repressor of NAD biosynthesis genes